METRIGRVLLAGTIAGLAGALAMDIFQHHVWTPRGGTEEDEINENIAGTVSRRIFRRDLTTRNRKKAAVAVHYVAGAAMGAAYTLTTQIVPGIGSGAGVLFALTLWLGGDEIAAPLTGLARRGGWERKLNELAAHLIYAATLDPTSRAMLQPEECRR